MKNKRNNNYKNTTITNRKAYHDYHIDESITCGIILTGTEVKSIRSGKVQLKDSFARIENGEAWLYNCHISQYQFGNRFNHPPLRRRKLLLKKRELLKLYGKIKEKNYALVPLKIFFSGNWAKLELALAKGKKQYDKRERLKKKELQKSIKKIKSKYV